MTPRLVPATFKGFCKLAYDRAGIAIKPGKEALVTSRISKRMRVLDISSPEAYLKLLQRDKSGEEVMEFLDAITTNFTSFNREADHFEVLHNVMSNWLNAGQERFRLWCAASSSGEEPYSIMVTLADLFDRQSVDYKLLATDISTTMLAQAKEGIYDASRIAPLTERQKRRYFNALGNSKFQVTPKLRQLIAFRRLNLAKPPFPMKGPLDVVFCRNVMIYFDLTVRQRLISEIDRLLKPGGLLLIGHAETLTGITSSLKMAKPSVYIKE